MRRTLARLGTTALLGVLGLAVRPGGAAAGGVYFVKEGDTVAKVAAVFRVDAGVVRAANGLDREIRVGDRIRIPDAPEAVSTPSPAREARLERLVCREEAVYHAVEKGDTLSAIARRYGAGVDELLALNGLRRRSVLSIGRRIVVRRSGPRTHVVRRGETLSLIAARAGVSVEELRRLNELPGDAIAAGQRLALEPCEGYDLAAAVPAPPAVPVPAPAPRTLVDRVVGLARTMLDIPYRFGGTSLRGIDCSAYVQRVFGLADTPLPRTAREQYRLGEPIPREDLSIGDLVFFQTYAPFPSHVGIYLGNNLFIHASSVVRKVTIDSLERPYYTKRFIGARRVLAADEPELAARTP